MATNLSAWYPDILAQIPSIAVPSMNDAIRKACRKFCKESWIWRYTLDLIDVEADTSEYTLTIPVALYADLVAIPKDGVKYKEDGEDEEAFNDLTCTSEDELDSISSAWRYETHPNPSKFYVDNVDKDLHLVPEPEDASTEGLEVTVILMPDNTCTTVPDFLFDDYQDTITAGALEDLLNRRSTEGYDPNLAQKYGLDFRNGYNDAKLKRFTGGTNKPLNVTMRFFA